MYLNEDNLPKVSRPKRRSTQIDDEQALMIEQLPEFKRIKLAGAVRMLLDEALAARKGNNMSFSLTTLRENLTNQSEEDLLNLIKISTEVLQVKLNIDPRRRS